MASTTGAPRTKAGADRSEKNGERRMPLVAHLLELRKRLVRGALGVIVGSILGWFIQPYVLASMQSPLLKVGKGQGRLTGINFNTVSGAFNVELEIALVVGVVISSPIWLYQIFAFITPAFTRQEKKYVFGFFFSAVPLFLIGCASGWLLVPHMVELMAGFAPTSSVTLLTANDYLDFVLRLVLVIGLAFVLPVFLVLLNFIGLMSGKAILKSWRIAILVTLLFTALATPSADVLSMALLAAPLIVLYFVAVGVAILHDRRKDARAEAAVAAAL